MLAVNTCAQVSCRLEVPVALVMCLPGAQRLGVASQSWAGWASLPLPPSGLGSSPAGSPHAGQGPVMSGCGPTREPAARHASDAVRPITLHFVTKAISGAHRYARQWGAHCPSARLRHMHGSRCLTGVCLLKSRTRSPSRPHFLRCRPVPCMHASTLPSRVSRHAGLYVSAHLHVHICV